MIDYNRNDEKYGPEAADDLMHVNEEVRKNYENAEALVLTEFKLWLTTDENFNEEKLLEFAKFKLPNPDTAVIWRTLDGWLEYGLILKIENGYKFIT